MLESSKDILNIVIAFSVLWFTLFVTWTIFYVAMILRSAYRASKKLVSVVDGVQEVVDTIKEKLHTSAAQVATLVEVGKQVTDYVQEKKKKRTARKSTKKKT